ncbi:unnamed protein product [Sphenostylis stenocarpa]|uniref:TIR domain-containing protein n=1 Tax=Sphenostylis stenocarpa TaxID=92480 RepID=A0AA86V8X1_9FABA|nr:unnamed protein product [Sphenostylis stenocarpa]
MASSSSCHVGEIKHDVFISFRGTDVRKGLLSHLIRELRRKQIDAYVDERLDKGGEISSSLLTAIEGSQILLVIFSKDFASSQWCLEELAKMVECMETNKQIVLPVFFNVDPSHVRHQYGDYGDALAKHEEKFKGNLLKVQSWRSALKKAGLLSGFHYPTNFENESDLVDEIVEDISVKLSKYYPKDSKDYVIKQLDAWGFYGASGLEVLQRKALITISNDNRIQMHDLIRQMGCEVVRQESIIYPGRRSRLRDKEEVCNVLRYKLGSDKVEALQIDVFGIKDLPLKLGIFRKMPWLRFLKFHFPLHADIFLPPSQDGNLWYGQNEFPLLLSAGCKELMKVASEIHIKCVDYLYIDGCSDPSLLNKSSVTSTNLGRHGVETISLVLMSQNESIGSLRNLECSDLLDQQFKTLADELLCLRSTYYLKLCKKSTGQDSIKPKLHILFDCLRFYERISVSQLDNADVGGNRVMFLHMAVLTYPLRYGSMDG